MAAVLLHAAEHKVVSVFLLKDLLSKKTNPKINRILVRSDFLRVAASGIRFVAPGFVLQKAKEESPHVRYGLTATKKLGNAVTRNRARRRLRALAEAHLLPKAAPFDYVLVAREGIEKREFPQLVSDLEKAIKVLKCQKKAP